MGDELGMVIVALGGPEGKTCKNHAEEYCGDLRRALQNQPLDLYLGPPTGLREVWVSQPDPRHVLRHVC